MFLLGPEYGNPRFSSQSVVQIRKVLSLRSLRGGHHTDAVEFHCTTVVIADTMIPESERGTEGVSPLHCLKSDLKSDLESEIKHNVFGVGGVAPPQGLEKHES